MNKNLEKLYQIIRDDEADKGRLAQIASEEELVDAIVEMGAKHGLPVTPEQVRDSQKSANDTELSDDELDGIVGGVGFLGVIKSLIGLIPLIGNDRLEGGNGNDVIYGFSGDDTIWGGSGNDVLVGGSGNDHLYGTCGANTLYGGTGNDYLGGGDQNDTLYGGADNDTLDGGDGNDILDGGTGDDHLKGGKGNDVLKGGEGNDYLEDTSGNNTLSGGAGNDHLLGSGTLDGGDGDDILSARGDATLTGGAGADTFEINYFKISNMTITDFNPEEDKFSLKGDLYDTKVHDGGITIADGNTTFSIGANTITLEGVELNAKEINALFK